ncbi:MAG: hypothetical protein HQ498_08245 [Pseudohongiella sp.]|jgi:hypothetical protein|nr:hypothetical protein [Pseudohongiella sp.]
MINATLIQQQLRKMPRPGRILLFVIAAMAPLAQAMDDLPILNLNRPIRLDFSGSWEKDFRRSDNWEDELGRSMRIRQEAAARQSTQGSSGRSRSAPPIAIGNVNLSRSSGRGANIVDVARLAEYISRQSTLKITQTREEIRIERRGEAALVCGMDFGIMETFANEHGVEVCGWDGQQLVFQIMLPDDLIVAHRFSVSADQQLLNLITSISSKGSEPFNLIQAFNHYDAPVDEFECVQTLSRGRVCNQADVDF